MNIENEGEFAIQELTEEDPHVARLYGRAQFVDNKSQCHEPFGKLQSKREASEPSKFKDEVYSQRAVRRGRAFVKVTNKFDRNVRKNREKAYILMLENKVQTLERQISKLKAVNRANQEYMRKVSASEQIYAGTFVGRKQIYQRMESLTQASNPTSEESRKEMIKEISTLRYRLGVHGKDRIKAINYYFKEILEAFIPQCQKFLIFTTCENFDFFEATAVQPNGEDEKWRQEMLRDMGMTEEKRRLLESLQPTIQKQKQRYDGLVQQFHNTKQQLMREAKNLEKIFDSFRRFLTPCQLTRILVNIEKNKYRKEMTMDSIRRFWTYDFKEEEQDVPYSLMVCEFQQWA